MKCELAQQHIVQYIYGELPDEACRDLEQHVTACEHCRNELQAYEALRHTMSLVPLEDPSPNLLADCRVRLDTALDLLPRPGISTRLHTGFVGLLAQLRVAPGMAAALAVVGFCLGGTAGHMWKDQAGPKAHVVSAQTVTPQDSARQNQTGHKAHPNMQLARLPQSVPAPHVPVPQVFNVSSIVTHPDTRMVEVHFNQMVPETVEGSLDDPEVQRLLLMATQNGVDPGVQSNSVDLLAEECKAGHFCDGGPVRTALMVALRYDRDQGVRLKALEGLQPYIAQDSQVRDAVLESLMHDPDQQIQSHALQMLEPVQADSSVRMVLRTVASQDGNPVIRNASLKVLRAMPPTE